MRFYKQNEIELVNELAFKKLSDWKTKWLSSKVKLDISRFEQKIFNEEIEPMCSLDADSEMSLKSELVFGKLLDLDSDAQVFLTGIWRDAMSELSDIFDITMPISEARKETLLIGYYQFNGHELAFGMSEGLVEKYCPNQVNPLADKLLKPTELIDQKRLELVIKTASKKVSFKEIFELKPGDVVSLGHAVSDPFCVSNTKGIRVAEAYLAKSGDTKVILIEK